MQTASFSTHVGGMTCRPCEDSILEALLPVRGVLNVDVSYWNATVQITYDPEIISEQSLRDVLAQTGYPPCDAASGGRKIELLTGAAALLLFLLIPHLALPDIPQVQAGANIAFLFVVGLVTGTHCICMCGGILLSQTTRSDLREKHHSSGKAFALYQAGRLFASMLLGVLFGSVGVVFSYSIKLKSMIYTICGAAILFIGIVHMGNLSGSAPHSDPDSRRLPYPLRLPEKRKRETVSGWHPECAVALCCVRHYVALCGIQWKCSARRNRHAGVVSGYCPGNGVVFMDRKLRSPQRDGVVSAAQHRADACDGASHDMEGTSPDSRLKDFIKFG